MPLPHLLLVGAGHAHLYLLRQNALLKRFQITLVDPGGFWYSGLASGVLAGDHRPSEDRIDPALLCRQNGVDIIRARLVALDHEQQRGMLSNGSWLSFDYLSLNLGSAPLAPLPLHSTTKGSPHYWPVKPIPRLLQCRRSLERRFHHLPLSLHVLGAGASGIEVACATRALARRHGVADMALPIHLHHRGNGPLAQASAGAQRYVRDCLDRRAITLRAHPRAETTSLPPLVDDEASDIIDARGLAPPQNLTHLGLPTLAGRGIAVAADLRIDGSTTQFAAATAPPSSTSRCHVLGCTACGKDPFSRTTCWPASPRSHSSVTIPQSGHYRSSTCATARPWRSTGATGGADDSPVAGSGIWTWGSCGGPGPRRDL